jgi:26S proteasome regulatory subunit N9
LILTSLHSINAMSPVDVTAAALEHLESMSTLHPDLSERYQNLVGLYQRKLWHQLTMSTLDFVSDPSSTLRTTANGTNSYLALFERVVLPVDRRLNQLALARIAGAVAFSLLDDPPHGDGVAARAVLENLLEKRDRLGPAAALHAESRRGLHGMTMLARGGEALTTESSVRALGEVRAIVDRNRPILAELAYAESEAAVVHSAFYETAMTYRKAVGPPEAYYREAVRFVSYANPSDLGRGGARDLAADLSLAALTGEGVFNFGEIATAPALRCLEGTELGYLVELLRAGARGDVLGFRRVADANADAIRAQPSLVSRAEAVREKIALLALVNMVFERPSLERTLSFEDIADRVAVPVDQVEWVVMRALSLKLIRGTMDQVDETVDVHWVMPRVLDGSQMSELAARFGEWAVKVSKTRDYMLEHTGALLNQ